MKNVTLFPVPPSDPNALRAEITGFEKELGVIQHLKSYRATLQLEKETLPKARYYLLQLDSEKDEVRLSGFRKGEIEQAQRVYLERRESYR